MRRVKPVVGLALVLTLSFSVTAPAAESQITDDAGVTKVTIETEGIDAKAEAVLREAVAALWAVIRTSAVKVGLREFPRSQIWAFDDRNAAARASGLSSDQWLQIVGYSTGYKAWIFVDEDAQPASSAGVTAHEAVHIIQTALTGGNWGSQCLAEGAADWYQYRTEESMGFQSFSDRFEPLKGVTFDPDIDNLTIDKLRESGLSEDRIVEYVERIEATRAPDPIDLSTESQFVRAHRDTGAKVYMLCALTFDLLLKTGGGEDNYFAYLAALRGSNWRTAFNTSFFESVDVFFERFDRYRASGFADHRLAYEIALDEFIEEYMTNCGDSTLGLICIT